MRRILRREGVQELIRRIGHRVRHSSDRLFYMRTLTKPVEELQPLLRGRVRRYSAATDEFSAIYRTFTDDASFTDRFAGRVFCDVAFVNDDPVAFLWTSLGNCEVPSLNAILRLTSNDAYLMEVYTRPAHRRKGVAVYLWNSVGQELTVMGYKRLFCLMQVGNRAMMQFAEATGFVQYCLISMRRLAPVERLIVTPRRPEYAGGLLVQPVRSGFLPFWRPRWALTVTRPAAERSSLE